ncbi:PDDEXK nuclease domain-containing protein [Duganella sp.]|uniref:PDDEXK nuclease domain-containing protein n=1 Tax=Duganella sp. TaxID=1904440 RepID=UPI0031CDE082
MLIANYDAIHAQIVELLESSRSSAARHVNSLMTRAYWEIGKRIVEYEQKGDQRALYGDQLLIRLSEDLSKRFGRGFSRQNLQQMRNFYVCWPEICQTISGKLELPWSAYVRLMSVKQPEARLFYESEALRNGWSVKQLERQVNSQFYERTALSANKGRMNRQGEQTRSEDIVTPEEAIKDPFVLEFLNLKDEYSESDLEEALIQHMADFLLELGDDFAFVGRQRRLRLDDTWFRIDLLFFHRRLQCLVVIELKTGKFDAGDAGKMHLYLNYAREHWTKPGENPPVGLILCAAKGADEARYALDNLPSQIIAADYRMLLPDEKLLATQLQRWREKKPAKRLALAGCELPKE